VCRECGWEEIVESIDSLIMQVGDPECSTVPNETATWALHVLGGLAEKIEAAAHATEEDTDQLELVEGEIGLFL
jgi:hypothetical protein